MQFIFLSLGLLLAVFHVSVAWPYRHRFVDGEETPEIYDEESDEETFELYPDLDWFHRKGNNDAPPRHVTIPERQPATMPSQRSLTYESLPIIKRNLINLLTESVLSKDGFKMLLNNPNQHEVEKMIEELISLPSQKVLQQKILLKLREIFMFYHENIYPISNKEEKEKVMTFLKNLVDDKKNNKLNTEKTEALGKMEEQLAILLNDPEVGKTFEEVITAFSRPPPSEKRDGTTVTPDTSSGMPNHPSDSSSTKPITSTAAPASSNPPTSPPVSASTPENEYSAIDKRYEEEY